MSLSEIRARIDAATAAAGRPAGSVTLIAVSKVQPLDRVRDALDDGQRIFGENRVQEAEGKWPGFRDTYGAVELHLLGALQTNKLARAVALFDAIHSLDRDRLARRLMEAVQTAGRCPRLFVEVNIDREPRKAGIDPDAVDAFVAACRDTYDLTLEGLMAIPAAGMDTAPRFDALRELAARNGLTGLSMGMSADFETAIAHGATHVRVGSALFGTRSALGETGAAGPGASGGDI